MASCPGHVPEQCDGTKATAQRPRFSSSAEGTRSPWITVSNWADRTGKQSNNVSRSSGPPAGSAESGLGSSAPCTRMTCIAVAGSRSCMALASCSPAANATGWGTGLSVAIGWTRPITISGAFIANSALNTSDHINFLHQNQNGCGGGHMTGSPIRSRQDRNDWTQSSAPGRCEFIPGYISPNSAEGHDDEHDANSSGGDARR